MLVCIDTGENLYGEFKVSTMKLVFLSKQYFQIKAFPLCALLLWSAREAGHLEAKSHSSHLYLNPEDEYN